MATRRAASPAAEITRRLGWALLVAALVVPAIGWSVDRLWGREVILLVPNDPALVELERSLWSPGDPVAPLYGSPASRPVRVLVGDPSTLLHPAEDPSLSLLSMGEGHPHPFQARTLWLFVRIVAAGFASTGMVGLLSSAWLRRRSDHGALTVGR